jgi:hypothetical protein
MTPGREVSARTAVCIGIATVCVLAIPMSVLILGYFAWISQSP